MNILDFNRLLDEGDGGNAYDRLTKISDHLAVKRVVDEDAFWNDASVEERKLFALANFLHLVGANGIESFYQVFGSTSLAMLRLASEALDEIGEGKFSGLVAKYLRLSAAALSEARLLLPDRFDAKSREQFSRCGSYFIENSLHRTIAEEFKVLDLELVGCFFSSLPESVMAWVRQHREAFEIALVDQ